MKLVGKQYCHGYDLVHLTNWIQFKFWSQTSIFPLQIGQFAIVSFIRACPFFCMQCKSISVAWCGSNRRIEQGTPYPVVRTPYLLLPPGTRQRPTCYLLAHSCTRSAWCTSHLCPDRGKPQNRNLHDGCQPTTAPCSDRCLVKNCEHRAEDCSRMSTAWAEQASHVASWDGMI
jgi:hypothetical protein